MTTPNSCPFCGYSNIKISSKHKWDWDINQRVEKYTHYCLCNKCHAKGPVTTVTIPVSSSKTVKESQLERSQEKAIELWNQRK